MCSPVIPLLERDVCGCLCTARASCPWVYPHVSPQVSVVQLANKQLIIGPTAPGDCSYLASMAPLFRQQQDFAMDALEKPLVTCCALIWAGRIQDGQLHAGCCDHCKLPSLGLTVWAPTCVYLLRTDKGSLTRWSSVCKWLRPLQTAKSWAHNAGPRLIAGAGRINDDQLDAGCCGPCKLPSLGLAVWAPTCVYLLRTD